MFSGLAAHVLPRPLVFQQTQKSKLFIVPIRVCFLDCVYEQLGSLIDHTQLSPWS